MSDKTPHINQHNVESVRKYIEKKNSSTPFHATKNMEIPITDFDHFPYNRHFRGVYSSVVPVVLEREAGYRKREDHCYKVNVNPANTSGEIPYPNHCFETSSKVRYPCYPQYLRKYSDKEQMDLMINNSCVSQFR